MANNKHRTKLAREMHLAQVAKMYLQLIPQFRIAEATGVTTQQITYDLKRLHATWQAAALESINAVKARELAKIDRLEYEYWDAWERSKTAREISTSRRKTRGARRDPRQQSAPESEELDAAIRKENQVGDPRFLQGVQWCLQQRAMMYGYDAPKNVLELGEYGDNEYAGISHADRLAIIAALFDDARARQARQGLAGLLVGEVEGEGPGQPD